MIFTVKLAYILYYMYTVGELVEHEERVLVHIKGVTDVLHKQKNIISELWSELDLKVLLELSLSLSLLFCLGFKVQ